MARKVLIVEDEIKIAHWLRTYFEQADFQVIVAGDGLTGLKMVQSEQPDIVILDIHLPGMDGLQLCQKIRQHQDTDVANIPIIMLTARFEDADRLRAFGLGADDYVPKPFSPKEVVARAQAIFRRLS
jgi:two-component system response regulator ResD